MPLPLDDRDRALRGAHFLEAVARLGDGVSIDRAREEFLVLSARLSQDHPGENTGHAANLRMLREAFVGDVRPALVVLLGAVAFVLLIACANVATLQLARATGRQKEMSIRRAVGASRVRIVQQLMTESIVIALIGGAAGLVVAACALAAVRSVLPPQFAGLPGISSVGLDARAVAATLGFSMITGLVFGIGPALASSESRVATALSEETRGASGGVRTQQWRTTLAIVELALSIVLLAGAALLLVSFSRLINVPLGFQPSQLTVSSITLPGARYGEHASVVAFFEALFERLGAAPGVRHVAAATSLPLDGPDSRLDLVIEDRVARTGEGPLEPKPASCRRTTSRRSGFRSCADACSPSTTTSRRRRSRSSTPPRHGATGPTTIRSDAVSASAPTTTGGRSSASSATPATRGSMPMRIPAAYLPQHQFFENLGAGFERTMAVVIRSTNEAAATPRSSDRPCRPSIRNFRWASSGRWRT